MEKTSKEILDQELRNYEVIARLGEGELRVFAFKACEALTSAEQDNERKDQEILQLKEDASITDSAFKFQSQIYNDLNKNYAALKKENEELKERARKACSDMLDNVIERNELLIKNIKTASIGFVKFILQESTGVMGDMWNCKDLAKNSGRKNCFYTTEELWDIYITNNQNERD